ncbi:MAG: hypothetical protein JNL28_06105 [Planctomycetes bacterium]|nr:hypothetical protein [Planctomycetota bacterium]
MNCILFVSSLATATLLLGSSATALPAPQMIAGDSVVGAAGGDQYAPQVAAGGAGSLVVWSDSRSTLGGAQSTSEVDVFALRLDTNGTALDVTAIPVAVDLGYQRSPQVAWNGSNWLVVWENQDATSGFFSAGLRGARISPNGTVLDPTGFAIRATQSASVLWSLCANGSDWIVAVEGTSAGDNDLMGVRIAADGSVSAAVVLQPADFFLHFDIRVLAAQGEVLLVWAGQNNPVARRFNSALAPIAPTFNLVSANVASNGSGYYVLWNGPGGNLVGSPMSLTGSLALPAGAPLMSDSGVHETPRATWDGSRWWVAVGHITQGVLGARVNADGSVVDFGGQLVQALGGDTIYGAQVAGLGSGGAQFVWSGALAGSGGSQDVFGRSASGAFGLSARGVVSHAAPLQLAPKVCAGPDGYVVAFESHIGTERRIMVQRLDPHGLAIDSEPLLVGSAPLASGPSVAWNGSVFCIVWNDGLNVVARRMAVDGTLLDAAPIAVMPGSSADVAAVDGTFLVVTTSYLTNPQFRYCFVRRLDGATGALLDPNAFSLGGNFAQFARVASLGDRWIVVYQTNDSHNSPQASIVSVTVRPDGSFDPGISLGYPGGTPEIAAGNGGALVVWRYLSNANANNDVVCRRIRADGTVGPQTLVSAAAGRQMHPTVAWTGTQWLLAWEDQRNQLAFFDTRTDIYGARVSADGALLDPNGFLWQGGVQPVVLPELAERGGRNLFVACVQHPESPLGGYRLEVQVTAGDCFAPARYCTATANSSGQPARIDASGSTSISADDLVLSASNLPANTIGLFFQGTHPALPAVAFGNGTRCVAGALRRLAVVQAGQNSVVQPQSWTSPGWIGVQPTSTRYVQFWFRDVPAGGAAFNTTDALELTFCP